ncbi:MAG: hypothetical protein FWE34_06980 [Defluviitaleaceae bacterium]|nr:hypothetical protein [Defluviitaleaceae bacterium]
MLLTDYLDTIENTDDEQLFLQKLAEIKDDLAQATKIPFVGKLMKTLITIGEYESIEEFKQSEHYKNIKGYKISVSDLEQGHFNIYPGGEQFKKMGKVLAVIGIGVLLLCLCLKRKRNH